MVIIHSIGSMLFILSLLFGMPSETTAETTESDSSLKNVDFTTISPTFHGKLPLPEITVMQCFVMNESTNELYVSQVIPSSEPSESYRLSRYTIDGVYLDSMVLKNGGHGTTFGIENSDTDVYIWSSYDKLDESGNVVGHDLVRFKYVGGNTLTASSIALTRYDTFTSEHVFPVTEQKNNRIAFRVGTGTSTIEIRNLDDIKNGINQVLHSISIPQDLEYFQGMSLDGDDLYWYSGDANSVNHDREITLFDLKTKAIKKRMRVSFGKGASGEYEKEFSEPEGIYLYTDPKTAAKSLFAGIVTGEKAKRINKLYAYHSMDNRLKFTNNK
ncbi:phage baseplate protein [Aquibacillus saliphilus]|uniref:phage baseplate protein n=1 Tax=Aquibacillus saliphilus TaxID=1909422 RepID=UPI001CF09E3D|nr:hypothetical protein [Aquibacillus saliphilus]